MSSKTLQTERPQQEHARKFVNALSCSSASELVITAGFAQAISWGSARALPSNSCLGANANLRLLRPVRLSFGTQHHDWPGTFSRLRVRGPFPPISRSGSMGPDPTGRDSNGDVQNDASTQESFRAQTAVLSTLRSGNSSRAMCPGTRHPNEVQAS